MPTLTATFATQCTSRQGLTGSFLYDPATGGPKEATLLSPVFADSLDLIRFLDARGWKRDTQGGLSAYVRNDDDSELVEVKDLHPGDMLDLEGDKYADETEDGAPNPFEFELAVVDSVQPTVYGTLVTSELVNCGFPSDHKVKVNGFDGRMVDAVTGVPATLLINGVALV